MNEIDKAIEQSVASLGIDNLKIEKDQIIAIKDNLEKQEENDNLIDELITISQKKKER